MGTLASAIATLENVNPAYNNPGAISGTGDTGSSFGAGIGIYSSAQAGQSAFESQLQRIYSGASSLYPGGASMTLDQFGEVYAPGQNYGPTLGTILGVPSTTPLSQIPSGISSPYSPSTPSSVLDTLGNMTGFGSVGSAASAASPGSWIASIENYLSSHVENVVVVVVGLILIAAGVFSFRTTQTIVQTATKVGKKAAEVSGA